jgi:glycosyltransferase involved in cell wall biosynthesis
MAELPPGVANQLRFEYSSAKKLDAVEWTTLVLHNGPSSEPFMRTIPRLFRGIFTRRLYGWIIALRLSGKHDIIMMRHQTSDPFAFLFVPLLRNLVTVHHCKEIEEISLTRKGAKGQVACALERIGGRSSVRNALLVLGVTKEIAEYERDLHAPGRSIGIYSNGVDLDHVAILRDERKSRDIEVAFICSSFAEWHGLDKLITAVDKHVPARDDPEFTIHLIGSLSEKQKTEVAANETRKSVFRVHGVMTSDSYSAVLSRCDAGIASLAMDRQNLNEGSTLKVREMLAMGLPVYSGHHDVALPEYMDHVRIVDSVVLSELLDFAHFTKQLSREGIRQASSALIDKKESMYKVTKQLDGITRQRDR